MARELWFLQPTAAAPLPAARQSPRGRSPEAPGPAKLFLARYRCRHYQPVSAASPARSYSPVSNRNHYCATTTPPGLSSRLRRLFSVAGKSFPGHRGQTLRVACGRPLQGRYYRPAHLRPLLSRDFREVGIPLRLRMTGAPIHQHCLPGKFTERWGVYPAVSSPHFPQSNGHAEAAVKS
ncbi:hypothetical protein GWK47_019058 [Chionoecetes opilio]|uniref:Uncharacterized protein n=1 Tax=Chionoecetes opilio TaxID=41210 RepID=A0A8J5CIA8_CHIOP|nr:hypothetical protein GWK47_019058 [Chionoecetes opilio]